MSRKHWQADRNGVKEDKKDLRIPFLQRRCTRFQGLKNIIRQSFAPQFVKKFLKYGNRAKNGDEKLLIKSTVCIIISMKMYVFTIQVSYMAIERCGRAAVPNIITPLPNAAQKIK